MAHKIVSEDKEHGWILIDKQEPVLAVIMIGGKYFFLEREHRETVKYLTEDKWKEKYPMESTEILPTLVGIIFKSNTSGAVYYWERGAEKAEVIIESVGRKKGLQVNCNNESFAVVEDKVVIHPCAPSYRSWEVIKEIHINKSRT